MTQAPTIESASPGTEPLPRGTRLWTRTFVLLCTVIVLCYCSNYLVTVVLPLFVQSLGGSPVVAGLVFTAFSVTSFVLRPLIGHLTDVWSVRGMLFSGGAILGSLALALAVPSIWVTLIANAIRGIGWGAFSTANATAVALTAPPSRRGEASGYSGMTTTASAAFVPAVGFWLLAATGQFSVVFAVAGAAGLAAAATVMLLLPNIGTSKASFWRAVALPRESLTVAAFIDRPVLLASLLLACVTMTSPVTFAFVPLHAQGVGVDNISLYFVAAGITSVAARLLLGRTVDRASRGVWIVAGYSLLIGSFVILAQAQAIEVFVAGAIVNAIGQSLVQPSLMAFAMDRAEPGRMGKAMATFSMAYRVGEGVGAPVAGALIVAFGYSGMYLGAVAYAAAGLILAFKNWGTVGKPTVRHAPV